MIKHVDTLNLNLIQTKLLKILHDKSRETGHYGNEGITAEKIYMLELIPEASLTQIKNNLQRLRGKNIGVDEGHKVIEGTKRTYSTGFYWDRLLYANNHCRYGHIKDFHYKNAKEIRKEFPKYVRMYWNNTFANQKRPDSETFLELRITSDYKGNLLPQYYVVNGCWSIEVAKGHDGKIYEYDRRLTEPSGCPHLIETEFVEVSEKEYKQRLK